MARSSDRSNLLPVSSHPETLSTGNVLWAVRNPYLDHSSQVPNIVPVLTEISPLQEWKDAFPHYLLNTIQLTTCLVYSISLFTFTYPRPPAAIFVLFTETYHKHSVQDRTWHTVGAQNVFLE